uniref:Nucleolar protein 9 n=1 Tax=Parastrongyloides trichosuri TaxID=131310 RepID=A0A0N4ZUY3_PARTI
MDRLIIEIDGDNLSNYLDIFDKLTHQSSSKNAFSPKVNLAWILLTKLIKKCSAEALKNLVQRVQKRLIDVLKVRVCDGTVIFTHTALKLFPSIITSSQKMVKHLATHFIQYAYVTNQDNCDEYLSDLVNEIFLLASKKNSLNLILIAISEIIDGDSKTRDADDNFLKFDIIINEEKRNFFVVQLLKLYGVNVLKVDTMVEINFNLFINIADSLKRFDDEDIKKEIFNCIKCLSIRCGHFVLPFISDILNVISNYGDDEEVSNINLFLCNTFGSASTLYQTFPFLLTKLLDAKDETNLIENLSTCRFFTSILRTCAYLLKSGNITQLLRKLLLDFIRTDIITTESVLLLNTFLSLNHEAVPIPISVAHTVIQKSKFNIKYHTDEKFFNALSNCKVLCSVLTRPRIIGLPSIERSIDANNIDNNITSDLEIKVEENIISSQHHDEVDEEETNEEYLDMKRRWEENAAILQLKRKALESIETESTNVKKEKHVHFEDTDKVKETKIKDKKKPIRPKAAFIAVINSKDESKTVDEMFADFCPE